ncbi:MAG: hypothetical protein PWP31_1287 [Clostridia bacterium]|nr:hypothetical protein [Clostridia bacterium]
MGWITDVALMPHPPIMVPEVGRGEINKIAATITASKELASELAAHHPDAVIIISPHGPVFRDAVGLWGVPKLKGDLGTFGAGEVNFTYDLNLDLTRDIASELKKDGVPVAWLDEKTCRQYGLTPEIDHGMMVPLYYLRQAGLETPLVALGMALLNRKKLYSCGVAIARAIKKSPFKVLVIASGDMSHRLTPEAPAGYTPEGEVFDKKIEELLKALDVEGIIDIPEELAHKAGECGLRSLIMALGTLDGHEIQGEVLSYEGPFGVGYLVAHLKPGREVAGHSLMPKFDKESGVSLPVKLARQSLEYYLRTGEVLPVPDPLPPELSDQGGAFVSIKKHGNLRGCIGTTGPTRSNLAEEIIYNALAAGLEDPRFPPISIDELPELDFSVDILGEPEPATLADLDPKVYGVIVSHGHRRGLLLPDLEGVETVEEQVAIALQKAGIGHNEPFKVERFKVKRYH